MRKYVPYVFAALAILATAAPSNAAEHPQKPGKWQVKVEMEMPGMPVKLPPVTTEICLTAEDLANPEKALPKDAKSSCKISNYKVNGKTVTWTMDCPKEQMKGTGEITYTENSYTGTMQMTVGEQEMSSKYSGKWLGDCKK